MRLMFPDEFPAPASDLVSRSRRVPRRSQTFELFRRARASEVDPQLWRDALYVAHGDASRIEYVHRYKVIVH